MRITSVIGARPQIIKAAVVSRALATAGIQETLIHTGQHYDHSLSSDFIEELSLTPPGANLEVGSGTHAYQTGRMLIRIEEHLLSARPNLVLLYGDTNSTLAGALAAAKLNVPIAHVEAGVRHYDQTVPEEINRVVTDHVSTILFCPTVATVENLANEGIRNGVEWVGDVLLDSVLAHAETADKESHILGDLGVEAGGYYLATIHRASNTDCPAHLEGILSALEACERPVVLPLHPRTRRALEKLRGKRPPICLSNVKLIEPTGYHDFLKLEKNAKVILTDSGGVQKEAYFLRTPCITVSGYSPWVETIQDGWNILVPPERERILSAVEAAMQPQHRAEGAFGDGSAAAKIAQYLQKWKAPDV